MGISASVIVPAYNAVLTIKDCLAALNKQALGPARYEIIVVDDGSSDATCDVVGKFPNVKIVRIPHGGPARARNAGVQSARSPLVLFTDADCEPTENWLAEMISAFNDTNCAGAKGTYRTRQCELIARFVQLEYEDKYARLERQRYIDFVDTYSAGYRRDVFLDNGGFDESFPSASVEDQELSFRLQEKGYKLAFVPAAVVYHRHPNTLVAYVRRKFRIGFWKVRVHGRHPGKVWQDSHTPPAQKIQVLCLFLLLAALCAVQLTPNAGIVVLCLLAVFGLSMLPLIVFMARRDLSVALVAPGVIALRAAAQSLGLLAGGMFELSKSPILKRIADVIFSAFALVVLAPVMIIIAMIIKLDSPGPVLFLQERAGREGHLFRIIKFRTMVAGAEAMLNSVIGESCLPPPVFKIPNDPRITRVGRWLRRYSLDELPQFFNVLKGDMSLVGPRPEEARVVAQYSEWHRRRLAVQPGITGPMQTSARGALSLDERVRLELDYIEHRTLWQDFVLLLKTIPAVIRGDGAY